LFDFERLESLHAVQWFDVEPILVRPTDYAAPDPDMPDLVGDEPLLMLSEPCELIRHSSAPATTRPACAEKGVFKKTQDFAPVSDQPIKHGVFQGTHSENTCFMQPGGSQVAVSSSISPTTVVAGSDGVHH